MNVNRGLVFWGVAFITGGVTALAIQSGIISADLAQQAWRYWPVVLIVIGIAIIAARTTFALLATLVAAVVVGGFAGSFVGGFPDGFDFGCGGETTNERNAEGAFGAAATVELELNCGDLAVAMRDGSTWSVDARYAGESEPTISSGEDSLRVASEGATFPFGNSRQDWAVTLPRGAALDLDVETNAGAGTLDLTGAELSSLDAEMNAGSLGIDLSGASVTELAIGANAGSISITVDAAATITGSMEVNAGSIELCAPPDAAIAITIGTDNITFSHNLDEGDLVRDGDTWSSVTGPASISLAVEGNAASFTFNPEDGCS